jgi:NADP-dependent 3-hydroxy acid dehydrogenase YdfG
MTKRSSNAHQRVLITGAAKGIGAAIVAACIDAGYRVIATDVDEPALAVLRKANPGIHTSVLDVRDLAAWERFVAEAEELDGPISVLINNAGVCMPGPCNEVPADDDRLTVEVNLLGVMNGVRTLLPRFLERKRGHIINVASMAAFSPAPELAAYCATKHAVRAYTHSCALDHRHSPVEFTVVYPSAVQTPMLDGMRKKRAGVVVFTEKAMSPSRVATAVVGAIKEPKNEVLVTNPGGKLIRFLGLFPGLLARGMDDAEKRGREALDR